MRSVLDASITNQEYEENINVTLKRSRHSDPNNVIFSYLNINSIRNRVGDLGKIVDGNIDILCIAEKKSDESFPIFSLYISIIRPNILDIKDSKGVKFVKGVKVSKGVRFVKSHIPSRRLNDFKIPSNIQIIPFEINFRKKCLVASICNAPSQKVKYFSWYLTNLLKFY